MGAGADGLIQVVLNDSDGSFRSRVRLATTVIVRAPKKLTGFD